MPHVWGTHQVEAGHAAFAYNATTHLSQNLDRRDKQHRAVSWAAKQLSSKPHAMWIECTHSLGHPFIRSFIHSFTDRMRNLSPPFRSIAVAIAAVAACPAPSLSLSIYLPPYLSLSLSIFLLHSYTPPYAAVVAALSLTHSLTLRCAQLRSLCAPLIERISCAIWVRFECNLSAALCVFRTAAVRNVSPFRKWARCWRRSWVIRREQRLVLLGALTPHSHGTHRPLIRHSFNALPCCNVLSCCSAYCVCFVIDSVLCCIFTLLHYIIFIIFLYCYIMLYLLNCIIFYYN